MQDDPAGPTFCPRADFWCKAGRGAVEEVKLLGLAPTFVQGIRPTRLFVQNSVGRLGPGLLVQNSGCFRRGEIFGPGPDDRFEST